MFPRLFNQPTQEEIATMAERKYTYSFDADSAALTKTYSDGVVQTLSAGDLTEQVQSFAFEYGLRQLLSDCHSGEKELADIQKTTAQKIADLKAGVTRSKRSGGLDLENLAKAVAKVKGKKVEDIMALLENFIPDDADDEETEKAKKAQLRKIRNVPEVKIELQKLTGKGADLDSLLSDAG